jgi:hypothetical protein
MTAEVVDGTHFTTYPAHLGPDCSTRPTLAARRARIAASRPASRRSARTARPPLPNRSLLEADVHGIHLRFPEGSDLAFVVAVLGALDKSLGFQDGQSR